jgi:hypothetical protein
MLQVTTPHRKDRAARKIQALIRGILARRQFLPKLMHKRYLDETATKIQRQAKPWCERRLKMKKAQEHLLHAVVTIQRVQRGRVARKYVGSLREQRRCFEERQAATLKIQACMRGKLGRSRVKGEEASAFRAPVLQIQRTCKSFLAKATIWRLCLPREPVSCMFVINRDHHAQHFMPFAWKMQMAPVGDRGTLLRGTYRAIDLFSKTGLDSRVNLAVTIQSVVRGRQIRRRAVKAKRQKDLFASWVLEDVYAVIFRRYQAATLVQKNFRGYRERKSGGVQSRLSSFLRQKATLVKKVQRVAIRYVAQETLLRKMRFQEQHNAAARIQARWRGSVARKHYAALSERATWPVKAWFEYKATGPDTVQVQVQFFPNPRFNSFRHFMAFGSKADLDSSISDMENEVSLMHSRRHSGHHHSHHRDREASKTLSLTHEREPSKGSAKAHPNAHKAPTADRRHSSKEKGRQASKGKEPARLTRDLDITALAAPADNSPAAPEPVASTVPQTVPAAASTVEPTPQLAQKAFSRAPAVPIPEPPPAQFPSEFSFPSEGEDPTSFWASSPVETVDPSTQAMMMATTQKPGRRWVETGVPPSLGSRALKVLSDNAPVDPHATVPAFPRKGKLLDGISTKQGVVGPAAELTMVGPTAEQRDLKVEELMRRQQQHMERNRAEQRKLLEEDMPFPQKGLRPEDLQALDRKWESKAGVREHRLRVAEKRRNNYGTSSVVPIAKAAGSKGLHGWGVSGQLAPSTPASLASTQQRVIHRHVHHHVHYHESQQEIDALPALSERPCQGPGDFQQPAQKAGWMVSGQLPKSASLGDVRAVPAEPGFLKRQAPFVASAGQLVPMEVAEDAETPRKQPFGGPRAIVPSPLLQQVA